MNRRIQRLLCALLVLVAVVCIVPVPSAAAASAEDRLENFSEEIYNYLKEEIKAVASGEKTSTSFQISDPNGILKWTKADLGVSAIVSDGNFTQEALDAAAEKFNQAFDFNRVTNTLLAELPYELFWYDKTKGIQMMSQRSGNSDEIKITSLTFSFAVSQDYASGTYATNPTKIAAASGVVNTAQTIVARHADKTDLEKLAAYRDEICQLVSYNHTAADNNSTPYSNPWQLINVFDGDSTTNVVCEGYAKAFKYLCDLTDFETDVECHLVDGYMQGGTGAGGHMWNVVEIGGGVLLVDVTNCDSGTVGAPDKLFLKVGEKSGDTYVFHCGSQTIYYTYSEAEKDLHTDGYLELKPMSEQPPVEREELTVTAQPVTQNLKAGKTAKFTVEATGEELTYQWQSSTNGTSWKNCSSSSATKATFSFTSKTSHNGNYYRCVITDHEGNVVCTDAVRLYVLGVTTQPKTQQVKTGTTVKFTVKATGTGLKYQWQSSSNGTTWKNCSSSSAKKASFSFTSKTSHNGNYYRCKITDSEGNVIYTNAVRLYVLGVTKQPATQKVAAGKTVKFTVTATGSGTVYQWQVSTDGGKTWKNCSSSSAKKATFTFTGKTSHSGNYYRCRIKDNGGNTVYTDAVKLYVLGITEQPVKKTVTKGKTAKFTVEATGASKVYQWQVSTDGGKTWKNCSSSSAKKAAFSFTAKTSHNGNYYRCRVKDSGGNTVYTNKVKLTVKK
ncbi:MAG: hypothetical protein IJN60_06665 [Oscillospiraceae bacterium]|nr:hypothetical protein [Oscillospiraceae bacterium]